MMSFIDAPLPFDVPDANAWRADATKTALMRPLSQALS